MGCLVPREAQRSRGARHPTGGAGTGVTTNLPTGSLPAEGASEVEHRERSDESETEPSDRSRRAGGHGAEGAFPSRNGVERWEWAWSIIDYI